MQFSLRRWRKAYDTVKILGLTLKNSRHSYDEQKKYVPPVMPLSEEDQWKLEKKIERELDKLKNYMDATGMNLRPPLWTYNRNDATTWASHNSFKYGHLLKVGI